MPSIFFPLTLIFALATETMGSLHLDIVGGDVVPPSSFPNYIAILTNDPPTSGMRCMGSLIAPQFILTAAHCVNTLAWALLGANYTSGTDAKEQIRITKHFIHPRFDEKSRVFDFAVHQLETPSQQPPVRVDWDDDIFTAPKTKAWIRGYGDTKLDGKHSETLLQTQVTIWPTSTCNDALQEVDAATMLCAGAKNHDTCHGDSGGPLTVMVNDHEELAGLTSWGLGCAKQGYPGVYARLSVAKNFVKSIITPPDVQCTNRPSLA